MRKSSTFFPTSLGSRPQASQFRIIAKTVVTALFIILMWNTITLLSNLTPFLLGFVLYPYTPVFGAESVSSNLTHAVGIYNSSTTPSSLPCNIYNYCNAPHVNAAHYLKPTNVSGAKLVYLNVMMRHHKVCVLI